MSLSTIFLLLDKVLSVSREAYSLPLGPHVPSLSLQLLWKFVTFYGMLLKNKFQIRILLCCLAIIVMTLWTSPGLAAIEISNVRRWAAPDHTRIVFDLSAEADYQFKIEEKILTLEFSNAVLKKSLPVEIIVGRAGIRKISFTTVDPHKCKIEIFLDQYLKADVFKLKKFMDKPDRVVVDIVIEQIGAERAPREQATPTVKKKVIVIDPGHGGEDPGAIGKKGTYEKHVVLAISREIKKAVDKLPGYRAVLTRDGDYYVSFHQRLQVAREANASLFISVHADAARNRKARGSSVYCLSTGAASNEAAKLLASNENLSDIIGGVPNGEGNNQSDEIILNMFQTNTINLSKTFATDLIDHLGRVQCLKYPVFQEAPFRVLKLLDIPAVLLETAYLSHAQEERLLKKNSFQKSVASAVASSVVNYFSGSEAFASVEGMQNRDGIAGGGDRADQKEQREIKTTSYRIKRGDTLHSIAQQFNTKVAVLLSLNHLKLHDPLSIGRTILTPAPDAETGAQPVKSYTVKKGDTLFSLARNSSMTVDELRKLNRMTDSDALLSGQKIKLPQ